MIQRFVFELLVVIAVFAVLVTLFKFIFNKITSNEALMSHRLLNPSEYLPDEEVLSLRQVYYLVMIVLFVLNIIYTYFSWANDANSLRIFDVAISIFLAIQLDRSTHKNKILLLLLVPYASLCSTFFSFSYVAFLDIFHGLVFLYFIKVYFDKFMHYTQTNSLGITIMLLFTIVFASFIITIPVEGVSPINSLEMVSNAFTSNGYAILGSSTYGKLNAIVLVWAGFILSTVGTATLTVSIVMKHVNKSFDDLEELVKRNKKN